MATQSKPKVNGQESISPTTEGTPTVETVDKFNIPDMPDEFEADKPVHNTDHNSQPSVEGSLSSDDLDGLGFNDERDEAEFAKLNPPTGDWDKEDRWKYSLRVQQGNCQPGDLDPMGRTSLNFMGKPKPRVANNIEYEPTLFIRISPDIRYKEDEPSKTDLAYRLFLKAKETYLSIYGQKAPHMKALRSMLEEDSYVIRTMPGDNGPVVVDLRAKRVKK